MFILYTIQYNKIMLIEKLKYITIVYVQYTESVKLMIQEHYDTEEYENCVFILASMMSIKEKSDSLYFENFNKRIYYFLEHSVYDYNGVIKSYDDEEIKYIKEFGITEFWSLDYDCVLGKRVQEELNIPFKFRPVRYTSLIKPNTKICTTPKLVDCCHVGMISVESYHRLQIINEIENFGEISLNCVTQTKNIQDVRHILDCCRYVLDITRNPNFKTQNQVRIFELLCMGYTVCAEKRKMNMFPGLIYEWGNVYELINIVKKGEYLHPTEAYKEMTYTNEAYNKYINNLIEQ